MEEHEYTFQYNKQEILDQSFIVNLKIHLDTLTKKRVKWLMTQADTDQINEIFKDYTISSYKAYRLKQKKYVNELLIRNY